MADEIAGVADNVPFGSVVDTPAGTLVCMVRPTPEGTITPPFGSGALPPECSVV